MLHRQQNQQDLEQGGSKNLLWLQACVATLTELLLEANGDAESEAGQRISEVLTDWELVVGARRHYNMNGLREMFSQPPHVLDPESDLAEVGFSTVCPVINSLPSITLLSS